MLWYMDVLQYNQCTQRNQCISFLPSIQKRSFFAFCRTMMTYFTVVSRMLYELGHAVNVRYCNWLHGQWSCYDWSASCTQ